MSTTHAEAIHRLRVERLRTGQGFGHAGHGCHCPEQPGQHHHHDPFCPAPTPSEFREAGIDPATYKPRSRA